MEIREPIYEGDPGWITETPGSSTGLEFQLGRGSPRGSTWTASQLLELLSKDSRRGKSVADGVYKLNPIFKYDGYTDPNVMALILRGDLGNGNDRTAIYILYKPQSIVAGGCVKTSV